MILDRIFGGMRRPSNKEFERLLQLQADVAAQRARLQRTIAKHETDMARIKEAAAVYGMARLNYEVALERAMEAAE